MKPIDIKEDKIRDEATQWLLTMEEDNSEVNQLALNAWLSLSAQHKKVYQQLQTLWGVADDLPMDLFEADLASLSIDASIESLLDPLLESTKGADNAVVKSAEVAPKKESLLSTFISLFTLRKTLYMASFASVVFAAFITFSQYNQEMVTTESSQSLASSNTLRENEYKTQRGEHKSITAPDGSVIILAAKSQVFIDYSANSRDIQLLQGEALFTVAKDKARPFIVHNHGRNVQALGTIFNVRESKTEMQVSVLEGVVEVSMAPNTTPNAAPNTAKDIKQSSVATLVAGQALELDSLGQFSPTYAIEVNERMAWQDGRLNYVNTELANVIFDLKRYSTLSIHIPDKQVANMGYTGSVIYDKVDDWLTALPYIFPVEVQRHGDSIVIVKREG